MGFDLNQMNQGGKLDDMLSMLPYPLDKSELITRAQKAGASQQIVGAMQALPNDTFESPEDIKKVLSSSKERH
jgi:hypothetical protein